MWSHFTVIFVAFIVMSVVAGLGEKDTVDVKEVVKEEIVLEEVVLEKIIPQISTADSIAIEEEKLVNSF